MSVYVALRMIAGVIASVLDTIRNVTCSVMSCEEYLLRFRTVNL